MFFVNELSEVRDCSTQLSDTEADEIVQESTVAIFEAIITPCENTGMDIVRAARFHLRGMADAMEVEDRLLIDMDLEKHNLMSEFNESCLNVMYPIKVFSIQDETLFETLE